MDLACLFQVLGWRLDAVTTGKLVDSYKKALHDRKSEFVNDSRFSCVPVHEKSFWFPAQPHVKDIF